MTPYDAALRVQRREVDAVKVSIGVAVERVVALRRETHAHDRRLARERTLAHSVPIATDIWLARMRAERARLDQAAGSAEERLAALRARAIESYGTMRAIESAADSHRDSAERAAANAEQSAIDDIAAARFLRARRASGRRTG